MIVRDHGEGGRWYVVCVHYPSAMQAKAAWERCNRKLDMRAGDEGIGIIRARPADLALRQGLIPSGVPEGRHPVFGITLHEPTALKCERILRDGESADVSDDFADALIARRARVVLAARHEQPGATGRVIIRRPEAGGARLDREGIMHEPEPGQG